MCKECFHFYFCWDTFLLRDFLPILNSLFPLSTTSLFPRITADRQNSVWLENSLYGREVEANVDNLRNFKLLFLVQCFGLSSDLWRVYSRPTFSKFSIPKIMSCIFLCFSYFWDIASTWLKTLVTSATLKLPNYLKNSEALTYKC